MKVGAKRARVATHAEAKPTYEELEAENARLRQRVQEFERKYEAELQGEKWKRLLWESDVAAKHIHTKLGAAWTAVLKEACCVREGVDKDKLQRLRKKGDRGPLRLWPQYEVQFKNMVPTVSLLEWCGRRKYKPSTATFEATARGGDWEAIKWLRLKKCPWHQDHVGNACTGAAGGGHLDVLKWLRKEGCPWNEDTCTNAAQGGHLDVLKYARENGCPWDKEQCLSHGRTEEIKAWIRSH